MQLKFKNQRYQEDASRAVADVFAGQPNQAPAVYLRDLGKAASSKGMESMFENADLELSDGYGNAAVRLSAAELLSNVQTVQRANSITPSASLAPGQGAVNLDVEMETGTGKTYVYTKTMFELNRCYGWTKFIVVVPSVAIREGVMKSMQGTEQHFFEQYGKKIDYFIYNSKQLNELDRYSQSSDINCMIINMQAFNTSMKEGGNSKEARIIFDERDEFQSRRPIDVIAANRPIIIMDEPQKMGGKATQAGVARFNPLFVLNYSATHKDKHDAVYVLDALDAFNQRLVKRIEVKGFELKNMRGTDGYLYLKDIVVSRNTAPVAVIEHKAVGANGSIKKVTGPFNVEDDIYEATGATRMEAYNGFVVSEIVPDMEGRLGYVRFLNGIELKRGTVYGDSAGEDMRRIQIRETIKSHLEKEEALFHRGIKCLSLFFIDEVAKYRDLSGNGELVGYAKVFEEEYTACVNEFLNMHFEDEYTAYLRSISAHATHDGYFSIDKKGHAVECKSETKKELENGLGIGGDDAERGYDLILKDKERLLSFDEPVRFIFSHSALREGWDNPNVFQICTLKTSGSETGKRQEVGRGLRLCVDQNGDRQDLATLGEQDVHRVNTLTVIASESYSSFVGDLQKDIASKLRERPIRVDNALFTGKTVPSNDGEDGLKITLTDDDARKIHYALVKCDLLDADDKPTRKFIEEGLGEGFGSQLPEQLSEYTYSIERLVRSVYDPHALDGMFADGNQKKVTENRLNDNFFKTEFQALWNQINGKHAYTVSFKDEDLRAAAIEKLNSDLNVSKLSYTLTRGVQHDATKRELDAKEAFGQVKKTSHDLEVKARVEVPYDLVGEVAQAASVTRRTAASILKGIRPDKFDLFKENPEEFIAKAGRIIKGAKAAMIADHVEYHEIDGTYDSEIFSERMPQDISRALETVKNVQDYVFPDSKGEREFAEELEAHSEVVVYAKLPRSFKIPTPVGNYAPDWAIAFREGSVRHVYFVAETKGAVEELDLRGVENAKISCARKLFNKINNSDVRYDSVDSYEKMLQIIGGLE